MNGKPIDVLLVDDHPFVRDGIRALLEGVDHVRVCGEAAGGLEAIAQAERLRPDVVIMDIGLPDLNGLEATARLLERMPGALVIVLTVYDNKEYILRAARIGARGYLVKNSPSAVLLEAIEAVFRGRLCYPPQMAELIVGELSRQAADPPAPPESALLSAREQHVLGLIADGLSNRQIATRMSLSVRTVETHRERIMSKLDIHTVAGLTKYAVSEGLSHID